MSGWEVFDRYHARYDEWFSRNYVTAANELDAVREALRGADGPCVEVGSGTGYFSSAMGCLGVEPSLGMALEALRRGAQQVLGRAEALPIRSSSLGAVLMVVTLCFLERPEEAVAESSRVLRPGGRLVSCIITRSSPWGRLYSELGASGHPFYSRARFYEVAEVDSMASAAGLTVAGRAATLTYGPMERPRREQPRGYSGAESFVCSVYVKPGRA